MRWFRMYAEMLDDEKVQMLSPELFKTWVNLLAVASTRDGVLPSVEALAFKLRVSQHDMQTRVEDLIVAGLLDLRHDKSLEPHNWRERQWKSDDSRDRVAKHRQSKKTCNGDVTVTVTPSKADTETDSDSELKHAREAKFENKFFGKGSRALSARLKKRAEGMGLDVAEFERRSLAPDVKIPNAFFRKLVADTIRAKHPVISETLIKAALSKDGDAAYGNLMQMLVEFA